jgi:hypothetical protein
MYYRGYDPAIGRMLQVDPYAPMYASTTTYNYAMNNPVMMNDPSGGQMSAQGYSSYQLRALYRNERAMGNYFDFGDWARDNIDEGRQNITGTHGESFAFDVGGALVKGGMWVEYSIGESDGKGGMREVYGSTIVFEETGGTRFENDKGPFGRWSPVMPFGPFTGSTSDKNTYFEGVRVYASTVGALKNRAAMTLPGVGIFVNPKDLYNVDLLRHEFGHILQAQVWGNDFFYHVIVPASIASADRANNDPSFNHQESWTEVTANNLAWNYFGRPKDWNPRYSFDYPMGKSYIPTMTSTQFYLMQPPKRPEYWIYTGR